MGALAFLLIIVGLFALVLVFTNSWNTVLPKLWNPTNGGKVINL